MCHPAGSSYYCDSPDGVQRPACQSAHAHDMRHVWCMQQSVQAQLVACLVCPALLVASKVPSY